MPTIKDWLASLGMSEYEGRFVEHGIDFDVLTEIDDSDLEKIGVLLGHRSNGASSLNRSNGWSVGRTRDWLDRTALLRST
jgi:hypothetical protein